MNPIELLESVLLSILASNTRFHPRNPGLASNGLRAADLYVSLSVSERRTITSTASSEVRKKMLAVSGFMAEEAMNSKDLKWIRGAVLLHVIEDFSEDYRENYRYLVLVDHAATKIGGNVTDTIESVLPFASDRASARLREFSERDACLNTLASFGVKEDAVDGRWRFVPLSREN